MTRLNLSLMNEPVNKTSTHPSRLESTVSTVSWTAPHKTLLPVKDVRPSPTQVLTSLSEKNGNSVSQDSFASSNFNSAQSDQALWSTARNKFSNWDADRNGFLTNSELETALEKSPGMPIDEKAALETLRGRQGELQKAHNDEYFFENDGITLRDLSAFQSAADGEAERLEEQFAIERGLSTESQSVKDQAVANSDKPAVLKDKVGTRDYYVERYKDFRRRNPGEKAPDYYLNYGLKYFDRFHAQKGELKEVSRNWVDRTGVALQQNMESKNTDQADYARLERNPEAFQSFAYESHPSAYLDSGLQDVPYGDRIKIGMTPDPSDLLTLDGVKQVIHTGGVVVAQDIGNVASWVGSKLSGLF